MIEPAKLMKVYLAGGMTHHPQFNFPVFDAAADALRGYGYEVVSPAELDDPAARAAAMASTTGDPAEYARLTGLTWADFLARDVKLIADGGFDAIVVLPGWEKSRGARLETFVGYLSGLRIYALAGPNQSHLSRVSLGYMLEAWGGHALKEDLDSMVMG